MVLLFFAISMFASVNTTVQSGEEELGHVKHFIVNEFEVSKEQKVPSISFRAFRLLRLLH